MAEQGAESGNGDGSGPETGSQARTDPEHAHEKHNNILNNLRMIFVEERLRSHGFKVDTTNYLDKEAAISSGKVIMVLGSTDDIKAEAEVATLDPDRYSQSA